MNEKKSQLERFKDAARNVGADTSDDALDKIMDKMDLKREPEEKDTKSE